MHAVRRRLRACAWLALLSIVALAAGPTVSRMLLPGSGAVLAGAGSQFLVEATPEEATVSSGAGRPAHHHHHAMAMGQAPAPSPAHDHALEHCGLCLLVAHGFTFVQEPPALTGLGGCVRPALTPIQPEVPLLRCNWSPASSRGPPLTV